MGIDAKAVVNSDTFAVNGIEGLYVADASLMPEMVSGNINAATILFAERCVRALLHS
jgi:choline dehydrogenase